MCFDFGFVELPDIHMKDDDDIPLMVDRMLYQLIS